ncbi:glutamate 5-kinase [Oceanicoccus sagamiensis]|uniref:Glutamate 5-kinase n=1 Tax=Oceanicoccus sagamiensis TaxID=716816 RepID=A0A1X9NDP5_9GAMM|nr:glutamate 5-kinase [Oceanicoccus sagamiensis]ARN74532.1 glutamate 5-kinase [Oceanicoccus sagamiensis]
MNTQQSVEKPQRWVVKIGSALLTANGKGLDMAAIADWTAQMAQLRQQGIELVLVSSGAVAVGMSRLGWTERPHALHDLQAAAALGQMGLVQAYESCFQKFGLHTAQVLLGHDDISARDRYLNARGTLTTLLKLGVIPVVNENDTVVTDEIRFGDNDTLAALVANLIDADRLVILTDQDGLYNADPRSNPDARLVTEAAVDDVSLEQMAGGSAGALGRGGMVTKIRAAKLAARSGANTVIVGGALDEVLLRLSLQQSLGTLLKAGRRPLVARKQWLAGMSRVNGVVQLDDGAVKVLRESGRSLLPVGVRAVSGSFGRGDLVSCTDAGGHEIARGLVNYNVFDAQQIIGKGSEQIEDILGYRCEEELIHRDNLVLV